MLEPGGVTRFEEISNIVIENLNTVSSKPVRVCHCVKNVVNCSQQSHSINIRRGNEFMIQVAAVDHVGKTVTATIHSSFNNSQVTLSVNQTA